MDIYNEKHNMSSSDSKLVSLKFAEDSNVYFGLILAVTSSLFIGSSFIIKKKALIRLNRKGGLRAGSGGFGYLREWLWWTGLLFMGIGEVANFVAYTFAPASLVTPLGALSVLVSAILSSVYLKEQLNLLGKLGCVLCLLGSTIIVIHSPMTAESETMATLFDKLQQASFVTYVAFIILISLSVMFHFGPKYGSRNVIWYIILCSAIGSLTVMSCKSLGITLCETLSGKPENFHSFLPYVLVMSVITCISIQMIYLNRALDLFNTSIVTPVYYVFFTTFVLIASSILFKEWQKLYISDIIGSVCGFLVIVIAVFLLNAFKNFDINISDIKGILKPKREMLVCDFNTMDFSRNVREVI